MECAEEMRDGVRDVGMCIAEPVEIERRRSFSLRWLATMGSKSEMDEVMVLGVRDACRN